MTRAFASPRAMTPASTRSRSRSRTLLIAALLMALVGAPLVACKDKDAPPPRDAAADSGPPAIDGRTLAVHDCMSCHTEQMLQQQRLTSAQWTNVVKKMTTWGSPIEPENTAALVAYLAATYGPDAGPFTPATLRAEEATAALAPLDDGPFAGGDAARGQTMFKNTCAPCHAENARGSIGVNLVDRPILYRAADVAKMVRTGRGRMPPLEVTDGQIADLVTYLRTLRGS